MKISELCYELYKVEWKRSHITPEIEMDSLKDYYEGLMDDYSGYTYDDYMLAMMNFSKWNIK